MMTPIPKALMLAVLIPFATTFLYGIIYFPYAPYRPKGENYTDKAGRTRTAEEFRAYQRWERVLFVTGGAWAVLCIGGALQHFLRTGSLRHDAQPKHRAPTPPVA